MYNGNGMEFDNLPSPVPQVSMSVLQGVIEKVINSKGAYHNNFLSHNSFHTYPELIYFRGHVQQHEN